ncbi:MAG: bifunctional (p)ppGpp synthetase/guanosine-3',5'-bis(diphosphate) 3'-pyrophosphohydrolase [Hyphomicrobiaceae bacterium]|nr:MAG: bifunctional (p)ppGpp synthetase/guanosine-3',5'-bis(diphosphate) 3'-pyrophosphohydrolase [Hyphomicrobiaceae bacterium]
MMRQYELVDRVLKYDPSADEALLNRAYVYAMQAHGNQKRASGDPFFSHPLEVAAILTELKLDDATISAALLHDVIEDTDVTRAEIDQKFGKEIGALVEGLTKIKRLDLVTKKAEQAENFRKLLVAISSDIRVLLIKLADRLHNMRTLGHMRPESRRRVSEETLEIYAPLAGRMGMQGMREELEELAFKWGYPDAYRAVVDKLAEIHRKNAGLVDEIVTAVKAKLTSAGLAAEVYGREKKPFSIWRKMENRQISLEQLSDIYGFRVVVPDLDSCYRALGIVHSAWRAVPGRFKDYVSTPKQNNYQSIHTTVVGPRHQRVELQIRTGEMHRVAEYGVAAHALYKDGGPGENGGAAGGNGAAPPGAPLKDNPYIWLRRLVDTLLEGDNPEEFLEHTKLELFQDQVFCFTPKGSLIALPRGATPIDFAYAVHTDVGNSCVGAIINGRQLPLTTQLRNGDEVEILISKGQTPPAAWERIAVTGKARSSIRRAARDALRRQYSELGQRLLASAFRRIGQEYSDERLKKGLSRLSQKSVEEVHATVGRGELPVSDVIRAVVPEAELAKDAAAPRKRSRSERGQGEEGWFNLAKVIGLKFRWPGSGGAGAKQTQVVPIRGLRNDVPVKFEEGGAVPGDRIVGVLDGKEGIRIFQIHSPRLKDYEHERWIDVTWDIDPDDPERFPAKIVVTALNEPGTLAQIAQLIGEVDGNIDNVRMLRRAKDFTEMLIEIEVWDLAHLTQIISGLKTKAVVSSVERVFI